MKRVLVFSALAAGLVLAAMPASAMPATNWTGFYAGGFMGMGAGTWTGDLTKFSGNAASIDFPNGTYQNRTINGYGWLGGADVGFAAQTGGLVWGLEGDISASALNGTGTFNTKDFGGFNSGVGGSPPSVSYDQQVFEKHIQTSLDWLSTLRARVGALVMPGTLLYGTGGLAVAGTSSHQDVYFDGANHPVGINYSGSDSATRVGWTIGLGLEQKLSSHWSFKAEYLYADLGMANYRYYGTYTGFPYGGAPGPDSSDGYSPKLTVSVVRLGFNYSFGG